MSVNISFDGNVYIEGDGSCEKVKVGGKRNDRGTLKSSLEETFERDSWVQTWSMGSRVSGDKERTPRGDTTRRCCPPE